jgi:hypothetical protein
VGGRGREALAVEQALGAEVSALDYRDWLGSGKNPEPFAFGGSSATLQLCDEWLSQRPAGWPECPGSECETE